jgi:competence ComEA-like helix-hairpin-helix protein
MWKDFFYFSRGQRIAIIVLLIIIGLVIALNFLLPYLVSTSEPPVNKAFITEASDFEKRMVSRDSLRKAEWQQKFIKNYQPQNYHRYFNYNKKPVEKYSLFPFDPNKADSVTLTRLGLKYYVASNILKFRKKGGVFKTPESFSKIYGISPEKFKELEPFIRIASLPEAKIKTDTVKPARNFTSAKVQGIVVELNSADTTELMKVYGIGRGYAKGIVKFRQQTGGFASVNQLRELYGMSESNFQKIKSSCTVNTALIRKIKVNTASVEWLNAHPYINFYQAKAIYELRREKGKLKSVQDLKNIDEIKPDELEKMAPYLSFE